MLKVKLPASIAEQVKLTEFDFERKVGHEPSTTEDIIRYIKDTRDTSAVPVVRKKADGREEVRRPHLFFSREFLHNYFYVKGLWREAREAHGYGIYFSNFTHMPGNRSWLAVIPYDETLRTEFFNKWSLLPFQNNVNLTHTWHAYSHMKPFAPDPDLIEREMLALKTEWHEKIGVARSEERLTKWEHQMFHGWVPFSQYAMLLICSGQIERLSEELTEYLNWWHHYEALKSKPNYWEQICHKVDGGHLPIIRFQILLPLLETWLNARGATGAERIKLAERALGLCYQWIALTMLNIDLGFSRDHLVPEALLFAMMMRLDLGVDLDVCREFVRYFKPYLTVFSHIREQMEALNVEYEPIKIVSRAQAFDLFK